MADIITITDDKMPFLSCVVSGKTIKAAYNEILEIPYDGLNHTITVNNRNTTQMNTPTGTTSGKIATPNGEYYEVYITLKNTSAAQYQWADGTSGQFVLKWRINYTLFPKPTAPVLEFDYEGNSASYSKSPEVSDYNANVMTRTGTTSAYKAGEYSITYSLKDVDSSAWADDTTDDVIIKWNINKLKVPVPYFVDAETFIYDGKSHAPTINGYNSKVMARSGNTGTYTNAGKYKITYTLYDPASCYWDDDVKSTTPKSLNWEIQKAVVRYTKPTLDPSNLPFKYNGMSQSPTILNFVSGVMKKTGTLSSVAACKSNENGEHIPWEITIGFTTNANYVYKWEDDVNPESTNSTGKVVLPWYIEKTAVTEPCFENGVSEFSFAGKSISPIVQGYDTNVMSRNGSTSATNCGKYTISYTLKDPESSWWENHHNDNTVALDWEIIKSVVQLPTIGNTILPVSWSAGSIYDQRPSVEYDSSLVSLTNYSSHNRIGKYFFTVNLRYPQYCVWEDTGTNESRDIEWEIIPLTEYETKPTVNGADEFTYDGKSHTLDINGYPSNSKYYYRYLSSNGGYKTMYFSKFELSGGSIITATAAGDYAVTIVPAVNIISQICWQDDNTTAPITFEWKIAKGIFPKPDAKRVILPFNGVAQTPEIEGYDSDVMSITGTTSATDVGEYEITYSLKDKESAYWNDGTTDDVVINWSITEDEPLKVPTVFPLEFTYNGESHSVEIEEYNTNLIKQSGTVSAINAGTYKIKFSLIDPDSSRWEDGSCGDKTVEWVINKKVEVIPKPYLEKYEYVYDAVTYTPNIVNFVNGKMTKSGDLTQRKANDNYTITIKPAENNNYIYKWEDGIIDDVILKWKIIPITIPVPKVPETVLLYGGATIRDLIAIYQWRQPLIEGYDAIAKYVTSEGVIDKRAHIANEYHIGTQYTEDGNYYGINQWRVGNYYIKIEPTDPESCIWEDTRTADKIEFEWSIVREIKLVPKPELLEGNFDFDDTEKIPIVSNIEEGVILSGDEKATAAGDYIITVSLDRNFSDVSNIYDYRWEDNTTDPISFNWKIKGQLLKVPELDACSYPYDGKAHLPAIIGFDENVIAVNGYNKKTAAGNYDIVFSLIDPVSSAWADGTTEDKVLAWTITKAKFKKPTISPEHITFDGEKHTVGFEENESEHSFLVSDFNSDVMTIGGTTQAAVVGDYIAVVGLKDTDSAVWDDDSLGNIELPWKIVKKIVKLDRPRLEQDTFVYDGTRKIPEVLSPTKDYLDTGISLSGDTSAINVGNYTITASLSEHHNITFLWGDLSSEPINLPWKITPIAISVPRAEPLEFTYDGTAKAPNITGYDTTFVSMSGTRSATNQGTYTITFSLKNKNSTSWHNDGTADIIYTWIIKRKPLAVNSADLSLSPAEFEFDARSHLPVITNYDDNVMNCESYTKQTEYGEYNVTVSPKDNYSWSDGTNNPVVLKWKITKKVFEKPTISPTSFEYDGTEKTPDIIGFDDAYMSCSKDTSATAAGSYSIVFLLDYRKSCEWADGTNDNFAIDWKITSALIKKPRIDKTSFVYDGTEKSPDIIDYNSNTINIIGTKSAERPGKYKITFSLKDLNSATWEDGTTNDIVFEWEILKKQLEIPTIENTEFIYNGGQHQPTLNGFASDTMNKQGTESAVNAGEYSVTISLRDTQCYEWADGSAKQVVLDWSIKRRSVDKPTINPVVFIYDGKPHRPEISGFRSVAMSMAGYDYNTSAGEYIITISLSANYEWSEGETEPIDLMWVITENPTEIPTVENLEFEYNGAAHMPHISGFDPDKIVLLGTSSAINAGDYQIIFRLADKQHNVWSNGTSNDIVVPWVIHKIKLPLVEVTNTEFVYNGGMHLPTVSGFDSFKMSYADSSVLQAIDAGTYGFTIILKDKTNYSWEDDTTKDKIFSWVINRKTVDVPYLVPNVFGYNGQVHRPEIRGFNPEIMYYPAVYVDGHETLGGIKSAENAGTYTIIISLGVYINSKIGYVNKNYKWTDGSTERLKLTWNITPKELKYPTLIKDKYEYNGSYQTPQAKGFDRSYMSAAGNVSEKERGVYNIGFALINKNNYVWADGFVDGTPITWEIVKGKLKKSEHLPIQSFELVYNGEEQTPTWNNYDRTKLDFKEPRCATNAGTYTARFSPNDNYTWEDGTADEILVEWVINKLGLDIPTQYAKIYYNGKEQEPVWLVTYHL